MSIELKPRTAILVLVVVLVAGATGPAAVAQIADDDQDDPAREFVAVHETNDGDRTLLWPYTSRSTAYEGRTLAHNVIVYGDVDSTERHLREASQGDWSEATDETEDIAPAEDDGNVNGTETAWGAADGSTRYAHVVGPNGEGWWLAESYQLHDGDYLGTRHHIRAYAAPASDQEWTAMQAHREHWDWFRLRHTVDGVEGSQSHVEGEFMDQWFVDDVWRMHVGNDRGSDSNGWMTAVKVIGEDPPATALGWSLLTGLLVGATVTGRRFESIERLDTIIGESGRRVATLTLAIPLLFLSVRLGAVGLERTTDVGPKLIAGGFYPFIFAGIPVATYLLARQLDRPLAFAGASLGFLIAVLLDYTYLGVGVLPHDVLIHRSGLAIALGFLASGASRPERRDPHTSSHVRLGVLLWLVAMALPLLQFV